MASTRRGAKISPSPRPACREPIQNGSEIMAYGLHPLMPEIAALYNAGNAAILANVGMLVQPTTRAIFQSNNLALLPAQLFSHSDQTNQWQSAIPNGTASTGWGGRVEDNLQTPYNALNANFTAVNHVDQRLRIVLHRESDVRSDRAGWRRFAASGSDHAVASGGGT